METVSEPGSPSSNPSSDNDSSSEESITDEVLESLLAKARVQARARAANKSKEVRLDEVILLDEQQNQTPLPALDPGPSFPRPDFNLEAFGMAGPSLVHKGIQSLAPSAPPPPPELNKDGRFFTKRQKKEQKKATTGPDWFDLPAPAATDLPKLHREVEALRLRNALDPKRFYRKEEGDGKGIKGLPKHFAIGTIIPSSTPFGTPSADNLAKSQRKRTIVDELVDDAEARRYAKKKFLDLQGLRGERGRGTWAKKQAARRGKW